MAATDTTDTITLITSDRVEFIVEHNAVKRWAVLKNMLDLLGDPGSKAIPIPNVKSNVMKIIIKGPNGPQKEDLMQVSPEMLSKIICAANYLENEAILENSCIIAANRIKVLSSDELVNFGMKDLPVELREVISAHALCSEARFDLLLDIRERLAKDQPQPGTELALQSAITFASSQYQRLKDQSRPKGDFYPLAPLLPFLSPWPDLKEISIKPNDEYQYEVSCVEHLCQLVDDRILLDLCRSSTFLSVALFSQDLSKLPSGSRRIILEASESKTLFERFHHLQFREAYKHLSEWPDLAEKIYKKAPELKNLSTWDSRTNEEIVDSMRNIPRELYSSDLDTRLELLRIIVSRGSKISQQSVSDIQSIVQEVISKPLTEPGLLEALLADRRLSPYLQEDQLEEFFLCYGHWYPPHFESHLTRRLLDPACESIIGKILSIQSDPRTMGLLHALYPRVSEETKESVIDRISHIQGIRGVYGRLVFWDAFTLQTTIKMVQNIEDDEKSQTDSKIWQWILHRCGQMFMEFPTEVIMVRNFLENLMGCLDRRECHWLFDGMRESTLTFLRS